VRVAHRRLAERGAGGGAAVAHVVVPAAAAQDAGGAASGTGRVGFRAFLVIVGGVPVGRPLEGVAMHVVEAPGIGLLLADRVRLESGVPSEPGVLNQVLVVVAEAELALCAGPAAVFPLGFRGQGVLLALFLAEPIAKSPG